MLDQQDTTTNTPLADCAASALRDLARKLKPPFSEISDVIEQVSFAGRALRAYRADMNGKIPADFLPRVLASDEQSQPIHLSIEELLVGAAAVAIPDEDECDPSEQNVVLDRLSRWMARACARRTHSVQKNRPRGRTS